MFPIFQLKNYSVLAGVKPLEDWDELAKPHWLSNKTFTLKIQLNGGLLVWFGWVVGWVYLFYQSTLSEMTCRKTRTKYLMLQIKTSAFGVSSIVTLL